MNIFSPISKHLILSNAVENIFGQIGSRKTGRGLKALAGFLLFFSLSMFIAASYFWFSTMFSLETTLFLTGLVGLFFTAVVFMSAYVLQALEMKKKEAMKDEIMKSVDDFLKDVEDEYGDTIRENPKAALALSSAAGLIAGRKIA